MLLKDSVGVLILKYATPLDPNFMLYVILDKSFKNDTNIKKKKMLWKAGSRIQKCGYIIVS